MKLSVIEAIRYYMSCDEASDSKDFAFVFHHVSMLEDKSVETAQIQRGEHRFPEIRVNPDFIRKYNEGDLLVRWGSEVLKHCLWHLLCGHADERFERLVKMYGDKRCQAAADLVVNKHMDAELWQRVGIPLVTPGDLKMPDDETLEYYIAHLSGEGEGGDGGSGKGEGESEGQGQQQSQEQSQEQGQSQPSSGDGITEDQWPVNISQVNPNFSEVDVQDFISHSQCREKLRGTMPGEADEYIEQLFCPPQVDWDYYLKEKEGRHRGHITRLAKNRPSRRCDWHIGRRRIGVLNVTFVIDTSGSMSTEELQLVGPEVDGILERGGAEIMLIDCDAGVANIRKYEIGMDLGQFYGRGGTSFDPAFAKIKEMDKSGEFTPDFIVYFTDGMGAVSAEPPPYDVLWVLTESGYSEEQFTENICKWGTVCKLKDNDIPSAVA